MITWVQINAQPIYTFYTVEMVKEIVDLAGLAFRRLVAIGQITRPCSLSTGSEVAHLSVVLDNSDGLLTEFFRVPPHRVKTIVSGYHNGRLFTLFRGTVAEVALGSEVSLSIEF